MRPKEHRSYLDENIAFLELDDCLPYYAIDSLYERLQWKGKDLAEVAGRVVRLEIQFRHARLHALHGDFHFADALDVALTDDGKPIDTAFMDY